MRECMLEWRRINLEIKVIIVLKVLLPIMYRNIKILRLCQNWKLFVKVRRFVKNQSASPAAKPAKVLRKLR